METTHLSPISESDIYADVQYELDSCRSKLDRLEQVARKIIRKHLHVQSVLKTAVDGIVIISENGVIQSFNPAAEKMFGYTQDEVVGRKVNLLMPEPYRSRHDHYIRRYLETGHQKIIGIGRETVGRRKDGSTFPIDLAVSEVVVDKRRYFTGIIKDITQRHQSASALKDSEERFRILVEAMNEGLAVQDAEGKIIYVNPRFCEILGYDQQCLMGTMVTELMDTASQIVLQSELAERSSSEDGMVELQMEKENGDPLHVHVAAKAIHAPDGTFNGSFVVVTDITPVKKLQRQLIQSQKMEAIGRLAGGVAHDFNNLLTVILGYAEISMENLDEQEPLYKNIAHINQAAKRAGQLTRQLLAFSRKQVLQPVVIQLNAIVSNIEGMLRRLIGEDILLSTHLDPRAGIIKADPGQIEQVIVNIAVNARDAMPGGGQLSIETQPVRLEVGHLGFEADIPPGTYAVIAISDTGVGMSPETQARIFEPFYTTKEKGRGTGLGLSTVYGIVKQSGGEITLYSEPGSGTCFKIYLPHTRDEPDSTGLEETLPMPECSTATILVVEDEAALRELVADGLARCGYAVLEAPDGQTALERYGQGSQRTIDLIVTDVIMPRLNGKELVSRMKSVHPNAKTLFISGYTDDAIVNHGVLAPGTPFLPKPFTLDQLIRMIQTLLDRG